MCKKTSWPSSDAMKPKPFSSSKNFTLPVGMSYLFLENLHFTNPTVPFGLNPQGTASQGQVSYKDD
jgi:hypothetical protein